MLHVNVLTEHPAVWEQKLFETDVGIVMLLIELVKPIAVQVVIMTILNIMHRIILLTIVIVNIVLLTMAVPADIKNAEVILRVFCNMKTTR